MMSKICVIIFVVALAGIAMCIPAGQDAACVVDGLRIKQGQSASIPKKCYQVTCESPQDMAAKLCPRVKTKPQCHESATDFSKPFPECCPQEVC